jgi:hypothetical protein
MNVWELFLTFEIALVSVVLIFVFVGWRRKARRVSKAHSSEHRLKIPNLWTEIQHVKHGTSTHMMRMKDGNFILLSVGFDTTKVLVGAQPDAIESFTELASFPVSHSHKSRRQQQEAILNDLRNQIGFPESLSQLREKLESSSTLGHLAGD